MSNEDDSAAIIARLEARVRRLEELLARRSQDFHLLAQAACNQDLEVLSRIGAGRPTPARSRAASALLASSTTTSPSVATGSPEPAGLPDIDADLTRVGPLLQRLLWADRRVRERVQEYGVAVVPLDFYSNTPSIAEITRSYEYISPTPPYLMDSLFDADRLSRTLESLAAYSEEFDPAIDGDETNCRSFFWRNSQFSYSDAMAYYCFIRLLRPRTVIEIGSGFSTLVAIEALRRNGVGTITCIEPSPRPFLEQSGDITLKRVEAQDVDAAFFNQTLEDGDVLFIDSTHTVKTGSDCLHIYLRLLPQIKRRMYIHAHDVFLPFGLPIEWLLDRQIFWTEQYLLLALIMDNPKAKVLYGSAYHHYANRPQLESLMGKKYPAGGGSFWFEYDGRVQPVP